MMSCCSDKEQRALYTSKNLSRRAKQITALSRCVWSSTNAMKCEIRVFSKDNTKNTEFRSQWRFSLRFWNMKIPYHCMKNNISSSNTCLLLLHKKIIAWVNERGKPLSLRLSPLTITVGSPSSNYPCPRERNFGEHAETGIFLSNKLYSQLSRFALSLTSRGCTELETTILRRLERARLHTSQTILWIYIYISFFLAQYDLPDKHTKLTLKHSGQCKKRDYEETFSLRK